MRFEDETVTKAVTNGDGQFVLNGVGGYETAIAVSRRGSTCGCISPCPPWGNPARSSCRRPGKLVLRYDIEGGEPEATVSLRWRRRMEVAGNERERKVPNRGRLVLERPRAGDIQVERTKDRRSRRRETVSPTGAPRLSSWNPARPREVALVRETGAAVEGEIIGLDKLKLPGALIYVVKPELLRVHHGSQQSTSASRH